MSYSCYVTVHYMRMKFNRSDVAHVFINGEKKERIKAGKNNRFELDPSSYSIRVMLAADNNKSSNTIVTDPLKIGDEVFMYIMPGKPDKSTVRMGAVMTLLGGALLKSWYDSRQPSTTVHDQQGTRLYIANSMDEIEKIQAEVMDQKAV